MFAFVKDFYAPKDKISKKKENNELIDWISVKNTRQLADLLRKYTNKLKNLDTFKQGMNEFEQLIIELIKHRNDKNIVNIISERIQNIIYGNIQMIGNIFIQNKHQTKHLRTNHDHYKSFFNNILKIFQNAKKIDGTNPILSNNQYKNILKFQKHCNDYNVLQTIPQIERDNTKLISFKNKVNIDYNQLTSDTDIENVINKIKSTLNPERWKRLEFVLNHRTDKILLILDKCYDIRNQYAMLRSAELFGIQNVWFIRSVESRNIKINDRISRSSQKWLSLKYFNNSLECIDYLKSNDKNRKIWVMDLDINAMELNHDAINKYRDIALNDSINIGDHEYKPESIAIVMGREADGPSNDFINVADKIIYLKQIGFGDSFNVSVACSLMLNNLYWMFPYMKSSYNIIDKKKLRYLWYKQINKDQTIKKLMDNNKLKNVDMDGISNDIINHDGLNDGRRQKKCVWKQRRTSEKFRQQIEEIQRTQYLKKKSNVEI